MMKQRPIVYFALLSAVGGLVVASVPVEQVVLMGLFGFMLMMHLVAHDGHVAPDPNKDEVAAR